MTRCRDTRRVTLIDQNNYHLFQPMLYQVATAGLSPADISSPTRSILRKQSNVEVLMARVTGIDTHEQRVLMGKQSVPSVAHAPSIQLVIVIIVCSGKPSGSRVVQT